jgi:hypothetical protein
MSFRDYVSKGTKQPLNEDTGLPSINDDLPVNVETGDGFAADIASLATEASLEAIANDPLIKNVDSDDKYFHMRDPDTGFKYDKQLQTNNCDCTIRRRPDAYVFINGTALCFENDENQHKVYKLQDENDRYNDLFMDFLGKYVFIRYNPDEYKDENKIKQNPDFNIRMKIPYASTKRCTFPAERLSALGRSYEVRTVITASARSAP